MWCIQEITPEYRKRMYDILDLYAEEYDAKRPVIGLDEKPKQLLGEKRKPILMKQGKPEKYDYEYKRNGKANIFVSVEPKGGERYTSVTTSRKREDFALFIKNLVSKYEDAEKIRIVLDNLNTHNEISLYKTFDKTEAQRILDKIEFHYTPKHASWLNVAEIEIGSMDTECTRRRIEDIKTLTNEVKAWTKIRNKKKIKITWKFTKQDADKKLSKHYVT